MTNTLESVMVESSAIYSAEYNNNESTMLVYFNNESIYLYFIGVVYSNQHLKVNSLIVLYLISLKRKGLIYDV
jgi:hypothetical protein